MLALPPVSTIVLLLLAAKQQYSIAVLLPFLRHGCQHNSTAATCLFACILPYCSLPTSDRVLAAVELAIDSAALNLTRGDAALGTAFIARRNGVRRELEYDECRLLGGVRRTTDCMHSRVKAIAKVPIVIKDVPECCRLDNLCLCP